MVKNNNDNHDDLTNPEDYLSEETEEVDSYPVSQEESSDQKTKKHKVAVLFICIAVLLGLVLAGFGINAWWTSTRRQKIIRQFKQEVEQIERSLRIAYKKPMHTIRQEQETTKMHIQNIDEQMKNLRSSETGIGYYAKGRAYFALHDYKQSVVQLTMAWNTFSYKDAEVAYALGQAMGQLYRLELEMIQHTARKLERELKIEEAEKQFRDPALMYLRKSASADTYSPAYAEGLIALYEKQYERAIAKAQQSFKQVPRLYEAKKLEGDAFVEKGNQNYYKNDYQKAFENYEHAGKAYQTAIDNTGSDPFLYETDCSRRTSILNIQKDIGQWQKDDFDNALLACNKALKINPQSAHAHLNKSILYYVWARNQASIGADPRVVLQQTIEIARQAIELEPAQEIPYLITGLSWESYAAYVSHIQSDPRPFYNKAIDYYFKALQKNPRAGIACYSIGISYLNMSKYEIEKYLDPRKSLNPSINSFLKAVWINPADIDSFNSMAHTFASKGEFEMSRGIDPRNSLESAIEYYDKALALGPPNTYAYNSKSSVYVLLAMYVVQQGIDPKPLLERSIEISRKALAINSLFAPAYAKIGNAHALQAEYEIDKGTDPDASFNKAIENIQKATSITPDYNSAYMMLAEVYHMKALYLLNKGKSPAAAIDTYKNTMQKMNKIASEDYSTFLLQGKIELLCARWIMLQNHSPRLLFEKAENSLKKALALNGRNLDIYKTLADIYRWRLEWYFKNNKSALQDKLHAELKQALMYTGRCHNINPSNAKVYLIDGALFGMLARISKNPVVQSEAQHQSEFSYYKAHSLNPLLLAK